MANTDLSRGPPSRTSSARMGSRSTVGPASTPTTRSGPSCSKPRKVRAELGNVPFHQTVAQTSHAAVVAEGPPLAWASSLLSPAPLRGHFLWLLHSCSLDKEIFQ